jgi:hypothetical protein
MIGEFIDGGRVVAIYCAEGTLKPGPGGFVVVRNAIFSMLKEGNTSQLGIHN